MEHKSESKVPNDIKTKNDNIDDDFASYEKDMGTNI